MGNNCLLVEHDPKTADKYVGPELPSSESDSRPQPQSPFSAGGHRSLHDRDEDN